MLIEAKNLCKRFDGVYAVDHLSIGFEKGKLTSLVGPNGSGKSTLVNVFSGLCPIDSGAIIIAGDEIRDIRSSGIAEYGIARTFQEVRLWEQMSVLDNILLVLTERSAWKSFFERHSHFHLEQAEETLEKTGLWDLRDRRASQLSYGQRKLLEIARVLAMRPEIVFLDEPFAGLFPKMVETVADILSELKRQSVTVILIEHNMELVRSLSDYIFVLDSGRLLAEGKPEEVLRRKDVMEAYLGE